METMTEKLLYRDDFRKSVFERDNYKCIIPLQNYKGICGKAAKDAHHIIERRLWQDQSEFGGYFLSNGASLCEEHHIHTEKNLYPPQYLWKLLKIDTPIRPKFFQDNIDYDKWGNPFKSSTRYKIKYPTTPYLPFSPQWKSSENTKDDNAYLENVEHFLNVPLTITIKLDGSNILMTSDHIAARNGTVADHKSFDYLKALHAQKYQHLIPKGIEIFGEWLYAKHSIHYIGNLSLDNYLHIFAVYDMDKRLWSSWDDVEDMAHTLGVPTVPVLKHTQYEKEWQFTKDISNIAQNVISSGHEGIVVRIVYPFHYGQFASHIAKYVRENHVQTDTHWTQQQIIKNVLKQ